jgi:hypothetical protein
MQTSEILLVLVLIGTVFLVHNIYQKWIKQIMEDKKEDAKNAVSDKYYVLGYVKKQNEDFKEFAKHVLDTTDALSESAAENFIDDEDDGDDDDEDDGETKKEAKQAVDRAYRLKATNVDMFRKIEEAKKTIAAVGEEIPSEVAAKLNYILTLEGK